MKLIQKLALDNPDTILDMIFEGSADCPFHLGYEKYRPDFCDAEWQGDHPCKYCWGREYIDKEEEK